MLASQNGEALIGILQTTIVDLVRRDGPDLSARQLGAFLTCYLQTEAQTVRGLAAQLNVSKPAITRALDRLAEFDLVRRKTDPMDRRSVLVQRTATGMAFLREIRAMLREAAAPLGVSADRVRAHQRAHSDFLRVSQFGHRTITARPAAVGSADPGGSHPVTHRDQGL